MATKKHLYEEDITTTSSLIRYHLSAMAGEYNEPHKTPDESDHFIKTHQDAVAELKGIRDRFEKLFGRKDYLEP